MTQTEIDPLEVLRALGISETPTIVPARGGFDMAMWKVELAGQSYALRVFRAGDHEQCERERVVMEAARVAGLPVPEVHRAGTWQDHPVLLITWLPGRTLTDELCAQPWRVWSLGVAFGRMHAAIHAVTAPDLLAQEGNAWIAWQCQDDEIIQDHLRSFASQEAALLHLDYHPNNVLIDGREITGIVDWTTAHAGDPRADAARTVSILLVDPLARKPLIQGLGLRVFELAWRTGYQRARGPLKGMPLFYAWAGTALQRNLAHRYKHMPQALAPARRWTRKWRKRAGLPD